MTWIPALQILIQHTSNMNLANICKTILILPPPQHTRRRSFDAQMYATLYRGLINLPKLAYNICKEKQKDKKGNLNFIPQKNPTLYFGVLRLGWDTIGSKFSAMVDEVNFQMPFFVCVKA